MRALSLWNPWATAIAVGTKSIETRSWSTSYRGPVAIHAAMKRTEQAAAFASIEMVHGRLPDRIPYRAIVALCDLVDVRPTEELELSIGPIEKLYGDFSAGRFGWILRNVRPVLEPISCRGRQGLFPLDRDTAALVRARAVDRLAAAHDAWWRPRRTGASA